MLGLLPRDGLKSEVRAEVKSAVSKENDGEDVPSAAKPKRFPNNEVLKAPGKEPACPGKLKDDAPGIEDEKSNEDENGDEAADPVPPRPANRPK